ncbi:MAG: TIGR04255 family protein [Oscillospiraceae bacterium]|nr:TIGR04255 family protein [Oscillospiraceae bacterium]
MFSKENRCFYRNNQLAEVVCQLRFPEILTIQANLPVSFQEAIRDEFPVYSSRKETPAPKLAGTPGNMQLQKQEPVNNYQFVSADGIWRVNLTSKFISLSCTRYTCWEDFARKLDKPLVAFIKTYKPAFFERVGLRYVNFFSRKDLDLVGTPYCEMFQPCYLGLLSEEDVSESNAPRNSVDAELNIRGGCKVKIHAGPGLVRKGGVPDKEIKFVFDQDLFMPGQVPVNMSAGTLQTLHAQAWSIFRGAITPLTHRAMDPQSI